MTADRQALEFGKKGGERCIHIDCDGDWEVAVCPNWVKAERLGDSLMIRCLDEVRIQSEIQDTLFIQADTIKRGILLVRNGVATFVRFSPTRVHFPQAGGSQEVKIITDGDKLNISYDEGLDVSLTDNTLSISTDANSSTWQRTKMIYVQTDYVKESLTITQDGRAQHQQRPIRKIVQVEPCAECGGAGRLLYEIQVETGEKVYHKCEACNGTGRKGN